MSNCQEILKRKLIVLSQLKPNDLVPSRDQLLAQPMLTYVHNITKWYCPYISSHCISQWIGAIGAILLTKINSISHGLDAWICNYMSVKMWLINTMCPSDTIWWNITGSTLAQVMDCCLTAPSHYPNPCWLLISEILWHSTQSNFTANAQATILYTVMSLKFKLLKSLIHLPESSELVFIHG